MRWPLYIFQLLFGLTAIALTVLAWRTRRRGWSENLIILPWLAGTVVFSAYLLSQVATAGWHDIAPLAANALWSNVLAVAGPVSVIGVMVARLWKRG